MTDVNEWTADEERHLVKGIRDSWGHESCDCSNWSTEAADLIESLRAERDRYRNALAKISDEGYPSSGNSVDSLSAQIDRNVDTARDALGEEK